MVVANAAHLCHGRGMHESLFTRTNPVAYWAMRIPLWLSIGLLGYALLATFWPR